jgi:hypothetical protein
MSAWPLVYVELDGVLAARGDMDQAHEIGPPLPGAVDFVRELAAMGRVVIYTCRPLPSAALKEWLDRHRIPRASSLVLCPPAEAVVIDARRFRAVQYSGAYRQAVDLVRRHAEGE